MKPIEFSLENYRSGIEKCDYSPPSSLCPFIKVDPLLYKQYENSTMRRGDDIRKAFSEIRRRTEKKYFRETYPIQSRILDYSTRSFPAYRFILPEVMTEDWLAILDWGKFQRDHVLHQPLCGYIILKLLNSKKIISGSETLLDACVNYILKWEDTAYIKEYLINYGMRSDDKILNFKEPIAKYVWRLFFLETAYIAAIFHDIGYPWQYSEKMRSNLDGLNTPAINSNKSVTQIIDSFQHRLLFRILQGYRNTDGSCPSTWKKRVENLTSECLKKTHGFPGALGFLYLNDSIRQYPYPPESPLHLLCIEWAAAAIMMHDLCGIYWGSGKNGKIPENSFLRLKFSRDPLSTIVALTDIIQDFSRPTANFIARENCVAYKYCVACSQTELIPEDGVWTIRYHMKDNDSRAIKRKSIQKEQYENFDSQYGYIDMSSLGIDIKMDAI